MRKKTIEYGLNTSRQKQTHTQNINTKFIIKFEVKINEKITMYEFKNEINVKLEKITHFFFYSILLVFLLQLKGDMTSINVYGFYDFLFQSQSI